MLERMFPGSIVVLDDNVFVDATVMISLALVRRSQKFHGSHACYVLTSKKNGVLVSTGVDWYPSAISNLMSHI